MIPYRGRCTAEARISSSTPVCAPMAQCGSPDARHRSQPLSQIIEDGSVFLGSRDLAENVEVWTDQDRTGIRASEIGQVDVVYVGHGELVCGRAADRDDERQAYA